MGLKNLAPEDFKTKTYSINATENYAALKLKNFETFLAEKQIQVGA